MRKNKQQGFTLIELVMVIVILGILAATALPKFIDLSGDANRAAVQGVAGSLSSAAAMNYAASKINTANSQVVDNCDAAMANSILQGGLPAGYTISGPSPGDNATVTCTVMGPGGNTAGASVTGT